MDDEKDPKVEALARVRAASQEFTDGEAAQEGRRLRLHAAIVDALKLDIGPSALEREAPYDRQHIDRIRKAAGIPPKRGATVQRITRETE